jgi:hypothetical protein
MNLWAPVVVSGLIQLVIAVYVYGRLTEKTANNTEDIKSLQKSDDQQWSKIGQIGEDVAGIKGQLGRGHAAGRSH